MAKPNKTAGKTLRNAPPSAVKGEGFDKARQETDFWKDMQAFQRGEMTAEEFRRRHDPMFKEGTAR